MDTPVLLIAWRRPHTLRLVINALRVASPRELFIACDGPNPRRKGEYAKVQATRSVIQKEIDWPCCIKYKYSDVNLGCKYGVASAINWFFSHVEEGIILEDDCIPHPDFFSYCTELLARYRSDMRIWCISGTNFQDGSWRGDASYYFGSIPLIWGWATWRRCWQHYDGELTYWPKIRDSEYLQNLFDDPLQRRYWSRIWQRLSEQGEPDTWDYQWIFTCLANSGLTILPNRNLVNNIGFGEDASHTTGPPFVDTSTEFGLLPIVHPPFILRHSLADRYTFDGLFGGKHLRFPGYVLRLPLRIISRLKRIASCAG